MVDSKTLVRCFWSVWRSLVLRSGEELAVRARAVLAFGSKVTLVQIWWSLSLSFVSSPSLSNVCFPVFFDVVFDRFGVPSFLKAMGGWLFLLGLSLR